MRGQIKLSLKILRKLEIPLKYDFNLALMHKALITKSNLQNNNMMKV